MLHAACATQRAWREAGLPPLRISINLSPRQFLHDGLTRDIEMIVRACHADAAHLELEITEGMVMQDPERAVHVLRDMRNIGVHIAIDDFGTGHSSLSYLSNFPVQTVKVDRSFVRQIDSGEGTALLAGAIVAMAHSLGLDVVAEGVETPAQCKHLVEVKCELLQGFLFSQPVCFESLAAAMEHAEAVPMQRDEARFEVSAA